MSEDQESEGWFEELGTAVADELRGLFVDINTRRDIAADLGTMVIASATLIADAAARRPKIDKGLAGAEARTLVHAARGALERVLDPESSELAAVWVAVGPSSPWHAEVRALDRRLAETVEM